MMAGKNARQMDDDNVETALPQHMWLLCLDHGVLCDGQDATYCMNGGTCYKITAMDTLTCVWVTSNPQKYWYNTHRHQSWSGSCVRVSTSRSAVLLSPVRCDESYKGSRCEQFQLFSSSDAAGQAGLMAALIIVGLLLLAILAVVIYYIHKWGSHVEELAKFSFSSNLQSADANVMQSPFDFWRWTSRPACRKLKAKQQSQQNTRQPYWKVQSRAWPPFRCVLVPPPRHTTAVWLRAWWDASLDLEMFFV